MSRTRKIGLAFALVLVAAMMVPLHVAAQRGGGGRGGGGGGRGDMNNPDPSISLTSYEKEEYGLKFPAAPDLSMFSDEKPSRFRQMLGQGRIVYMTNLMGGTGTVSVRVLPKATEADLKGMKASLDGNPPQAKLPEYKKISLGDIKIGVAQDKDAVEYVYSAKGKDAVVTTREVAFVHKGNGFMFVCSAPEKDFAAVNKKSFDALFSKISFF